MRQSVFLALANMRKHRGQTISLLGIVVIAALLLNLGLLTAVSFGRYFDEKAQSLRAPHAVVATLQSDYRTSYSEYFASYRGIVDFLREEIIFLPATKFRYGNGVFANVVMLLNADAPRSMLGLSFVGDRLEAGEDSIYVSYLLKTGGRYNLGDEFVLSYMHKDYRFRIAGFVEDAFLGSMNMGGIGFYLPEAAYRRVAAEVGEAGRGVLLAARLINPEDSVGLIDSFNSLAVERSSGFFFSVLWSADYALAKSSRTFTASIIALLIVAFSLIVMAVSFVVTMFRINHSIDEDITNIGVLKAVGYTSRRIIAAIVLQFSSVAAVGGLMGIAASYLAVSPLSAVLSAQTGLVWNQRFDLLVSAATLVLLVVAAAFVSVLAAARISRVHPIMTLRKGLSTHTFRKNMFPLESTRGSLNLVLGLKNLMGNLRQNVVMLGIISAISFASVFSVVLYYNMGVDNTAFVRMLSGEQTSAIVIATPTANTDELLEGVQKVPGVRKAIYYNTSYVVAGGHRSAAYVVEDFAEVENDMLYQGRYPRHYNEISVGGRMAEKLNKKVGDTIQVEMGNVHREYLISGLHQNPNNYGRDVMLTLEGMKHLQPNFRWNTIYVYGDNQQDLNELIARIKLQNQGMVDEIINYREMVDSAMGVFFSIAAVVAVAINVVTAAVMGLMLYMVIRTLILRKRQALGVQKAVGFTTIELMQQIAMTFLPVIMLGVLLGGVMGYYWSNPLFARLLGQLGVMKVHFAVKIAHIGLLGTVMCGLAYGLSMWVASEIRGISAYTLIRE